jgi:hypothetical protein
MSRSEKIVWDDQESPFGNHPDFTDDDTLGGARAWMLPQFREGDICGCPCCGQAVKLYPRSISGTMARSLAFAARKGGATSKQLTVAMNVGGGGDHAKLIHWGLMREADGVWYCTELGLEFLRGKRTVPRYIYQFNKIVFGRSAEVIGIADVLDKPFSIEELMDPASVKGYTEPELSL